MTLTLINPVPGATKTGGFGDWYTDAQGVAYQHRGWDLDRVPAGTPIIAPCDGTIVKFTNDGSFGWKAVCIWSDSGLYILLAHCSASYVTIGQRVIRGQRVADVGNEGTSTGAHCHVQVCDNSTFPTDIRYSHDPESYLVNEEEDMALANDLLEAIFGDKPGMDAWLARQRDPNIGVAPLAQAFLMGQAPGGTLDKRFKRIEEKVGL